jgi:hypothetical protein
MIKVANGIDFGKLYIKPAFVFVDGNGHVKLQFEADANSALAYLYDSLCKELGISWNYESPSNSYGKYTNCAMHATGDRGKYGCGPDNANIGFFFRDLTRKSKGKKKKKKSSREDPLLGDSRSLRSKRRSSKSRQRSRSGSRAGGGSRSGSRSRSKSRSRGRSSQSMRTETLQPFGPSSGASVASTGSQRSGVFDISVSSPQQPQQPQQQDDDGDHRQQLV